MKNDILKIDSASWLVLHKVDQYTYIIKQNVNRLIILKLFTESIIDKIECGEIILELKQESSNKVIDVDSLSNGSKDKYEEAKKIFDFIASNFNHIDWLLDRGERASVIKQIVKKFNICENTVRNRLLTYYQSGMSLAAMIPKYDNCGTKERTYTNKKPGPKGVSLLVRDKDLEKIYSIMIKRFLARGANIPYTRLYEEMISEFFSDNKLLNGDYVQIPYPIVNRPTIRSFTNWINTHTDEVERHIKKQGKRAVRNNYRPLFSDTIAYLNVKAIGSRFEMDEVETDFYLVNRRNRKKPIGRAIVYFIIDVFSRAIVACGIGLDNNSWSGAEVALLNMIEDKKDFCKRYGINIKESDWPMMNAIPCSLIVDNGAEYLSNQFSNLTNEIGIGIDYVPPQMGSFKSNVEQKFRQMNLRLKGNIPGVIDKEKYGRPHIKNARLDIFQFSQAVIQFILNYNNSPMDNYPESKDMYEAGLILTPNNIWNYSLARNNELKYVHDIDSYKYSLLKRDKASITRYGIEYQGRYFICDDIDWLSRGASMAALVGCKNNRLNIRFDMRWPDIIYYEKEGYRYKAYLNCPEVINMNGIILNSSVSYKTSNSKYANLTEPEIRDILEEKKKHKIYNNEIKLKNNINTNKNLKRISKEAYDAHEGVNDAKSISMNRKDEKDQLHLENHIVVGTNDSLNNSPITDDSGENEQVISVDFRNMSRIEKFRWIEQNKG